MQRANQITSVITLFISIALIWGTSKMPYRVEYSPAAGFFPFWLGIALAIISLALFFRNIFGSEKQDEGLVFPRREARKRILLYLAALTLCILLIRHLGFVIPCFLFAAFTLIYHGKYRLKKGLISSFLIVGSLYVLFNIARGVP